MTVVLRAFAGAILATAIALAGYRARTLTRSGAIAAVLTGMVAVAAGWGWGVLLISYFVSSSLLSRLGGSRKQARLNGVVEKPGARDATQVLANGLPFVACALL